MSDNEYQVLNRAAAVREALVSPFRVLPGFPVVRAGEDAVRKIRSGREVNLPEFTKAPLVKVFDGNTLICIARRIAGTLFHPKVVLLGDRAQTAY